MLRAAVVVASVCAGAAAAAPVPPLSEKETIVKLWGKTEGQGDFELKGKQLTLRTLGQPARGFIHGKRMDMPRTTRVVRGDFEATVAVSDATPPNPKNKYEDSWPGTRAGLFVSGEGYCVELHLYQYHQMKANRELADDLTRTVWVDTWFLGGGAGRSQKPVPAGKSAHLRITRKDKVVTVSHSFDGKGWAAAYTPAAAIPGQVMEFPDEVTVGVFFAHSTHQIAAATFDALVIAKPK